ncbi:ATP-binding protein [Actinokineospora alba]|nr:LuxR family transcriptional regulator [Actinokineospora alba]
MTGNVLARLHAALDDALAGRLRVVLCTGEPGIGKTTLLRRFADEAASRGVRVRTARSPGSVAAPPYWLWRQALGDPNPLDALGSAADPAALVERVAERVRRDSAGRGVVLIVDDLHLADSSSLGVLMDVLPLLHGSRVLLCATHDAGAQLPLPEADVVRLVGLSRDESMLLLGPTVETADHIFETAGGNPLFLRELGRYLKAGGDPHDLPRTLDDVVAWRLRELSPPTRGFVEAAAILGDTVRPSVVARVLGQGDVLAALDDAVRAGFVGSEPDGLVEFDSRVVRTAVVACLPPSERARLHRRAALAIEAAGNLTDHLGELTHHWTAAASAGASAEARAWARRAGDEAMRVLAFGEARRLYALALDHADGLDAEERADLLLALASAAFRQSRLADARQACGEALAIARRLDSGPLLARVALTLEPCGESTWDGDLHRWCTEALARSTQDDPTRARLLARLARTAVYCGHHDEADAASAEALRLARGAEGTDLAIDVLTARQLVCAGPDHTAEVVDLAAAMIATGRPEAELWGRLWLIDTRWYAGDLAGIAAELPRLRRTTEEVGGPYARWHLLVARAALALARAEFDDAERLIGDAVEHFERLNHPAAHGASVSFRLLLGHHRGHTEELLSPTVWDFGSDSRWELFARLGRAFALVGAGRLDEAATLYQRCGSPRGWSVPPGAGLVGLGVGAQVAAALGLEDDTRLLRDRLTPYRGRYVVAGAGAGNFLGPVELTLGKCAAALGDWDTARTELGTASELCRTVGAPGFRVEADCELATALARAAMPEAAATLAERTRPVASALGMTPWIRRLDALRTTPDPLTAREREIAALVAQGLSNRRIAENLVIAERTAQNHVQHILTKLGFANRAQIAAWSAKRPDE